MSTAAGPVVMTLMVRDEADIVAANIEHHLAQGIDRIIVTDNGSVDGTREILADYAERGLIELRDDPRHAKQQAEVVTAMARHAFTRYGAAWVCNVDADEFWIGPDGTTVAEALAKVPEGVRSFPVPVRNLLGRPAADGAVLLSHVWRDERDEQALRAVGLHAHPSDDCVHRGDPAVEVVQGNHGTNLPLTDREQLPAPARLEVLHLPYRGWKRYRHRVETSAAAYARSGRTPSPRHHGMRDARWLAAGQLEPFFAARHPELDERGQGEPAGFVRDERLAGLMRGLRERARIPERLAPTLEPPVPLAEEAALRERHRLLGPTLVEAAELRVSLAYREQEFYGELRNREFWERTAAERQARIDRLEALHASAERTAADLAVQLDRLLSNPIVREYAELQLPGRGLRPRLGELARRSGRAAAGRLGRLRRRAGQAADGPQAAGGEQAEPDPERAEAEARRLAERAEAFAAFQALWQAPPEPERLLGEAEPGAVPLIMCLWNRPGQIDELLRRIDGQRGRDGAAPRFRLLLWNNCARDRDWYEERIRAFRPAGALSSVEIVHSPHNIRGVARFVLARLLYRRGARGSFLMLDDDELIGAHALPDLLAAGGRRRLAGFWSWRAHPDDYWRRERAGDGEPADYVATCGCVCDLEIVADDAFFRELPEAGLFIEDVWMSRFALARGWQLRGAEVEIEFTLPETNQYGPLVFDKVAFWSSLNRRFPLPEERERRRIP